MQLADAISATWVIGTVGFFLTLARRWNNSNPHAGEAVAGWTIAAIIIVWVLVVGSINHQV